MFAAMGGDLFPQIPDVLAKDFALALQAPECIGLACAREVGQNASCNAEPLDDGATAQLKFGSNPTTRGATSGMSLFHIGSWAGKRSQPVAVETALKCTLIIRRRNHKIPHLHANWYTLLDAPMDKASRIF